MHSTFPGRVCPLHGGKYDNSRKAPPPPPPPPELVAAAGSCSRSRSPLPYRRHARWDNHPECSTGACNNDHLAAGGVRPFSPGYGWAEPGKGWTRSLSRSRLRQRQAAPRVCPRHGVWRKTRESTRRVEPKHVHDVPQSIVQNERGCDEPSGRHSNVCASSETMDGVSQETFFYGRCARNGWDACYPSRGDTAPPPRNHDEARDTVDYQECPESTTMSAAKKRSMGLMRWNSQLEDTQVIQQVSQDRRDVLGYFFCITV